MMEQNLEHTVALLERTPASLDALLRDLPEVWTHSNEGENTWSAHDVVAHLGSLRSGRLDAAGEVDLGID